MLGSLIGWTILGLVAGLAARFLHPGNDAMGLISTIVLGVLGSILGGGVAYVLKLGISPYEPGGWILATLGAVILLVFGWYGSRGRAPTV